MSLPLLRSSCRTTRQLCQAKASTTTTPLRFRTFSNGPVAHASGPTADENASQRYVHKRVSDDDKNVQSDNAREGVKTREQGSKSGKGESQDGLDAAQASSAGGGKESAARVFAPSKKDNIGTFSQVGGMTDGTDSLKGSQQAGQTGRNEEREQEVAPAGGSVWETITNKMGIGSDNQNKKFSTSARSAARKAEQGMDHHTNQPEQDSAGHHSAGKSYSNQGNESNTSKPREGLPSQDQSNIGSETRGQGVTTSGNDGRIEPFEASQEHTKVDKDGHGQNASSDEPAGSAVIASASTGKPNVVAAQQSTKTQMPGEDGRPEQVHGPDGSEKPGKKHINQETGINKNTTAPRQFSTMTRRSFHSSRESASPAKPLGKSVLSEAVSNNPSDPTQSGRANKDAKHQSGQYSDDLDPDHTSSEGFGRKADAGELPNAARANIGYDDKLPNNPSQEVLGRGKKGSKGTT